MLQPPNYLLPWLQYTDYLTHKLHSQSGNTQLQVLHEEWLAEATQWDQTVLHIASKRVLHRDIVMLACNTPCWFARTILPETTYQSDLTLFARLQHEPLGNLIFQGTVIQRVTLRHYPIHQDASEYHWLPEACHGGHTPLWARMSTFQLTATKAPFYLIEILLPELERYSQ